MTLRLFSPSRKSSRTNESPALMPGKLEIFSLLAYIHKGEMHQSRL